MCKEKLILRLIVIFAVFFIFCNEASAQKRRPKPGDSDIQPTNNNTNTTNPNNDAATSPKPTTAKADSGIFKHRDDLADSITISYKYLDSLRSIRLDSSLNDFNRYFSLPANHVALSNNNGSPAYPVLFTPILKAGWDAGFHALDVYRFSLEQTRFYKTTRPYTQLSYLLASGKEQMFNVLHTQNIKPNWNFGFEYRLIAAPGFYKSQNTNHNSYRIFSNYTGKRKRYNAWFLLLGNKLKASENAGLKNDSLLTDPRYTRLYSLPVNLGGDPVQQNYFNSTLTTGNTYRDNSFFFRHSYDLGKKDSIAINDSTTEYLFYPKLRFQHTFISRKYRFQFLDTLGNISSAQLDSAYYKNFYDTAIALSGGLKFSVQDEWKVMINDFSLRQFPETKNPAQFIDAGLRIENYTGTFSSGVNKYYNLVVHGEYRNKTRNKKWDALAKGELYINGFNAGDYNVQASVTRFLNTKLGNVQIAFQNVNRTPSFIFDQSSSFNFRNGTQGKKENIIVLSASADNPFISLFVRNIAITNYTYFSGFYKTAQESSLLNVLQAKGAKKLKLTKHLNLYSDVIFQQTTANSPIHIPLLYTRQRLAFEGVFFRNLNLSTGLDVNYNTPYKYNNYSPVMGQFVPQDSVTSKNLPNVSAFFNFRIKSFTGLIKLENLNAVNFADGLSFNNFNFTAPHYPTQGLVFRLGIQWAFVN